MFDQAFKNIDDILWKEAGCTTEPKIRGWAGTGQSTLKWFMVKVFAADFYGMWRL
jgi:hypothetical protein